MAAGDVLGAIVDHLPPVAVVVRDIVGLDGTDITVVVGHGDIVNAVIIRIIDKAIVHNLAAIVLHLIDRIPADGADIEVAEALGHIGEDKVVVAGRIDLPSVFLVAITSDFVLVGIAFPGQPERVGAGGGDTEVGGRGTGAAVEDRDIVDTCSGIADNRAVDPDKDQSIRLAGTARGDGGLATLPGRLIAQREALVLCHADGIKLQTVGSEFATEHAIGYGGDVDGVAIVVLERDPCHIKSVDSSVAIAVGQPVEREGIIHSGAPEEDGSRRQDYTGRARIRSRLAAIRRDIQGVGSAVVRGGIDDPFIGNRRRLVAHEQVPLGILRGVLEITSIIVDGGLCAELRGSERRETNQHRQKEAI